MREEARIDRERERQGGGRKAGWAGAAELLPGARAQHKFGFVVWLFALVLAGRENGGSGGHGTWCWGADWGKYNL